MQKSSKKMIEDAIASNKAAIKHGGPKIDLKLNPEMLIADKEFFKKQINSLLLILREHYNELLPYVKKIKSNINDITENTHVCAVYLLLCNIFDNWDSFFLLAEKGKSIASGSLIRLIKEGVMQVEYFSIEALNGDRIALDKWFSGNIIEHGKGREAMSKLFEKFLPTPGNNYKDLSASVYQVESQVSHNAYGTILEMVSPFSEDYDFDGYNGHYRAIHWLRYAIGSLEATNMALRSVYLIIIKDLDSHKKIDEILTRHNSRYKLN
jgi:hypothetical protein